MFETDVQNQAN